jgi:nitroreductase
VEKIAETQCPIHDLLRRRWSPRAFAERPVEPEKLCSLLEAARWAPSSFNEQPWFFLVAIREDREEFNRMLSCLVEGNVAWAQKAPVLMISVAKLKFEKSGKPNRHAFYDVGQAVADMTTQATSVGLSVHQMAGILVDKAREVYNIPQDYEAVAGIAVGYPGEAETLSGELRERELAPRNRRALESFVFTGGWGVTSPLVRNKA